MSDLFWLTDAQMAKLKPFFPKFHGQPRVEDKRVLIGIIFINRNGVRWGRACGIRFAQDPLQPLGRPLRMLLTAGQRSDYIGARALPDARPPAKHMLAGRGHDAEG